MVECAFEGPLLELTAPHATALTELLRCCAVVSQSSLRLDSMKEWNSGAIKLAHVLSEGLVDPVGSAVLRFALHQLGGKLFWQARAPAFTVHAAPSALLTRMTATGLCYVRCLSDAIEHVDWLDVDVRQLGAACDALFAQGRQAVALGVLPEQWDGTSVPRRVRFLGLLGLYQKEAWESALFLCSLS